MLLLISLLDVVQVFFLGSCFTVLDSLLSLGLEGFNVLAHVLPEDCILLLLGKALHRESYDLLEHLLDLSGSVWNGANVLGGIGTYDGDSILIDVDEIVANLRGVFPLERLRIRLLKNGGRLGDWSERRLVLKLGIDGQRLLTQSFEGGQWLLFQNFLWWSILILSLMMRAPSVVGFRWGGVLDLCWHATSSFEAEALRVSIWRPLVIHEIHAPFVDEIVNRSHIHHVVVDLG